VKQLSLFEKIAPEEHPPILEGALSPSPGLDSGPGQLGLFDRRAIQLKRIGDAIADAKLDEAHRWAIELQTSAPGDADIRRLAAAVDTHRTKLVNTERLDPPARATELLALARTLDGQSGAWSSLRLLLLRRVAQEIHQSLGDAGEIEGQPAGYYLLEAGDFAAAKASLTAAAAVHRRAHTLFLLADAAFALGDPSAGRLYLEALLVDPFDPALALVKNPAVRALPDAARDEFEIEEAPEAWSAPVGVLTGVLPPPTVLGPDVYSESGADEEHPSSIGEREGAEDFSNWEAVRRARQFIRALVAASSAAKPHGDAILDARRAMKRLCPTLFAAYMRRVPT
jgi:hypothetical protein